MSETHVQFSRGRGGGNVGAEDVATYEPPEKSEKMVPLNVRVPESTKAMLGDVVTLWKLFAKARGDDGDVIDLSYVIRRAFRLFVEQSFAEFGGRPTDEDGWKAIESAIAKSFKKSR